MSVITISLNDLEGLKSTVESVRAQRYGGRIEHIVIDGGSGDAVVEYLSGDPGFAYWQSQPDNGRYDAMNQGIAHSSGDLLWFMHSTDRFSDPDAVASVVEALSGHGPVRDLWGYGKNNLVGLDGKPLFPRPYGYMPFKMRKFLLGATVAHQATFFGASLVAKLGGYDLDFGLEADQLFIYRAALIRPPVTIDRVVCDFDVTGPGSTQPIREHYRTLRRLWDLHGDYPLGGRRVSWAYLRVKEYLIRADLAAFNAVKFLRAKFARASRKQNSSKPTSTA
ncbi:glycosyltransferase [Mycobacterium avium subsp. paratuberculosis]|nr:glycosyltransferase [Mycobacterium avium subsp. paratuberculosis]MBZ4597441.1 glycosyltransferase [Mycobacterium avium subsp. hominissuis]QPM71253.1 glycosyltransferase [Mycobacterium avium subsp. paratuberculosis S397]QQK50702.1 glycosyltransferase [Mycobacterium avium subsp. paratuberculosis]